MPEDCAWHAKPTALRGRVSKRKEKREKVKTLDVLMLNELKKARMEVFEPSWCRSFCSDQKKTENRRREETG
jgi:hypothetical protein